MKINPGRLMSVALFSLCLNLNLMAADAALGEKIYQQACAMCHASGVAGAPILGDQANWAERVKKDKSELYNSATNGLGAMPAKGGQVQLSDADVIAAVDHMLAALDKKDAANTDAGNEAGSDNQGSDSANVQAVPVTLTASQEQGKEIAFDRGKGNCLACHQIMDGDFPGNSGPPLNNMKVRFPDRQALHDQIYDATVSNPSSIMIPYGRHQILTPAELDLVTDFIHAL